MSSFRDSLDPFSDFWQPGSGEAPGDAILGKNGDSGMVDPSAYIPLIEAQADVNRVNTINPYGSSFFVDNNQIGQMLSGGPSSYTPPSNLSPGGASAIGRSDYIPQTIPQNTSGGRTDDVYQRVLNETGDPNQAEAASRIAASGGSATGQPVQNAVNSARNNPPRQNPLGEGVTQVTSLSPELQPLLGRQIDIAGGSPYGGAQSTQDALIARALNPETTNQAITDATFNQAMDLLNPQFEQQDRAFEQRLANQGIQEGSEAWNRAYENIKGTQDRARQNAAYQAVTQGQQAALSERGQNINELTQAARQGLQGNQSQSQLIAQLLGGNQPAGIQPLDVTGPANMAANQNLAQQQMQQQNKNSATNAGVGLGSAWLMAASDERLKKDKVPIGERNGVMWYLFKFKDFAIKQLGLEPGWFAGVMSKDVPWATIKGPDGYDRVVYSWI